MHVFQTELIAQQARQKLRRGDSIFVIAGEFSEGPAKNGHGSFSSNSVCGTRKKVQPIVRSKLAFARRADAEG